MKKENKWINCIMAREDCWEESKFYSDGKGTFFEKQRKEEHLLSYNERGELIRKIEFPEYDEIDTRILIHNSKIYVEVIKKLSGDEEYECTLQCVNYEGEVLCSMKRESFLQDWRILPNGYVDLITMQEHCIVTEDFKEKFCVKGMCMLEPGFIEEIGRAHV